MGHTHIDASRTVWLSWSEPWASPRDGASDTTTWIDVYGPGGHAGYVVARMPAEQASLVPSGVDDRFFTSCAHLVAREARLAYDAGDLVLPTPFVPARHSVEVSRKDVDERTRSADLPVLDLDGGRDPIGGVTVADTHRSWPLTFASIGLDDEGQASLTLEIDAEDGPILTFDVTVAGGVHRELDPHDPYWRAVAALAAERVAEILEAGDVPAPDSGCALDVTLDLAEAARLATDEVDFARFIAQWPTEWPA